MQEELQIPIPDKTNLDTVKNMKDEEDKKDGPFYKSPKNVTLKIETKESLKPT